MYPSWLTLLIVTGIPLLLAGCGGGDGGDGGKSGPGVISGTIEVASGTRSDADTALDLTVQGLESSRTTPINGVQNGSSPFPGNTILGGYVSAGSGTYSDGFGYPQDSSDELRLRLADGQRVTVNVFPAPYDPANPEPSDAPETRLKLESVDDDSTDEQTPANEETTKSVQAQGNGEHDLTIEATGGGPARYVLRATSLSQGQTLGAAASEILPGEAVVTMEAASGTERMRSQAGSTMSMAGQQRALGGGQHHVRMPREREAVLSANVSRSESVARTLEWIRELEKAPGVASASPNHRVRALTPTDQTEYEKQEWHYDLINLEERSDGGQGAWDKRDGSGVRAAVLDTGVSRRNSDWHPELAPNIDCNSFPGCYDAVDGDSFPLDESDSKHGTHVAGTLGADASDSDGKVTGVAHAADLVPVRVLGSDEGSVADVIEGIRWVVNEGGQPRADLINLSLGSQTNNPSLADAIADAEAAGVIVVAASGNAGDDRRFFPAAYSSVLAVGSVDCTGARSSFSNFGVWLDLVAPGGGLLNDCGNNSQGFVHSTVPGGTRGLQGTSMAAPHVSGVMAMLRQSNEDLSPAVARALIREGEIVTDRAPDGFGIETGRGRIDAEAAASRDWAGYAALAPDREVFELGDDTPDTEVRFSEIGSDSVSLSGPDVTGSAEWLEVTELEGRRFRVALDTSEMSPGIFYRSTVEVSYSADGSDRGFSLPVTATLEGEDGNRNAGAHFVQLIPVDDSNEDLEVVQELVEARDGRYSFEFDTSEIEPGSYYLKAGTDMDNDGAFCGPGEACAEYLSEGRLRKIEVTRTMDLDVTLETAFTRPVDTQADPGYRRANDQ
ncbi:MAG: S8 family peptidase [Pseudomonadota bacterium]